MLVSSLITSPPLQIRSDHLPFLADFEKFWTVASKLIPVPNPLNNTSDPFRNSLPMESRDRSSSGSATSLPSNSNSNTNGSSTGGGNELMRSIPMRIYLPEGAPVIQNVVPPSIDGLSSFLLPYLLT